MAALLCQSGLWAGKQFPAAPGEQVVPDELIIRVNAGGSISGILTAVAAAATYSTIHQPSGIYLVKLPPGLANAAAAAFAARSDVAYVEPNRIRQHAVTAPNDPNYSSQWDVTAINAPAAWNLVSTQYLTAASATGQRLAVAVLDTGVDCGHPDFVNSGGTSANSASGGQINTAASRAFVASTLASSLCTVMDDNGHGTHVAGTIAAATQNGLGVTGIAWPVTVVSFKVLDKTGNGNDSTIAQAIMAAADAGIPIVSMSLGGAGYSQSLQDAITYAWQHNTLAIAAAGNSSTNALTFPAGANYALGVSATDANGNFASFSNYGSYVAIAAPGVSILSTAPSYSGTYLGIQNYATLSGTSMATPHVSAVAALVAMTTPGATPAVIAQRLQQTATSTSGGWTQNFGYGIVNAAAAVAGTIRATTVGGIAGQVVNVSGLPVTGATVMIAGQSTVTSTDGMFRVSNLAPGDYTVTATASGQPTTSLTVAIVAGADTRIALAMNSVESIISGQVTSNGTGVANAAVQALANGAVTSTAVADASGRYWLPVTAGTYQVNASAIGAVTASVGPVSVGVAGTASLNISLSKLGTISGTVVDASSQPVSGAAVSIAGSSNSTSTVTDASGHFQTIGLPSGNYVITAVAGGLPTVTQTVAVTANTLTSAILKTGTSTSTFTAIRLNAGGAAYTDSTGTPWSSDNSYSGGGTYATGAAISGTQAPVLYQSCRFGNFSYTFSVPNGSYTVILKFAEPSRFGVGLRQFNAAVNGSSVLTNFDIFAAAGGNSAIDKAFPVTVTGGQIWVTFSAGAADLPLVSGIDIEAGAVTAPPPTTPSASVRVNAGGGSYTDAAGNIWAADNSYAAGNTYITGATIGNTSTPALYQSCRYGDFTYTFSIPNGSYRVTLKFAEPSRFGVGLRQFNVAINGSAVLTNFDIYAAAGGGNLAVDKSFTTTVTGGTVWIQFTRGAADLPLVNAIDIEAATSLPSVRINSGGGAYTDGSASVWAADNSYAAGNTYATGSPIGNTSTPALYQTCRYGNFTYAIAVPNGSYTVTLKFAEPSRFGGGLRQFNAAINGSSVLTNFDIYTAAGGGNLAVDKSFAVTVTGGTISIQFSSGSADLPLVNAIDIEPAS